MTDLSKESNCQIPCLPKMAEGEAQADPQPVIRRIKRTLARPWNYTVKRWLKQVLNAYDAWNGKRTTKEVTLEDQSLKVSPDLLAGDWVKVRSREEIQASLDRWKELKGCAFLDGMWQYCGTSQRVLKPMERFLDERDYKVKKVKGLVLLEGVICDGTPVFGRCDRGCHLFWREEWLEKIDEPAA